MELGMLDLRTKTTILASAVALAFCIAPLAHAQEATTLSIALKDHRFVPAELTAPVNKPITIIVGNQDPTPSEFESKSLRVEKVVAGGAKISVQIRALAPGRYRFFDDYHEDTTEGFLVVK
jgi:Cupredoxin-like domain